MGPDWVMLGVISFLGLAAVVFGIMGYSPSGVPFSSGTRITGSAGKIVGTLCILFGLAILWFAGRVFGPKPADAFAHGLVQTFPVGAAIYAAARIAWLMRSGGERTEKPPVRRGPRASRLAQDEDGFISCPHCGKRMVDTAPERCRYCGETIPQS
jgi:hypothetical protein